MPERLQKYLARAGVASRRKCEELITQGKVEVDGKIITELGTVIDGSKSRVKVNGELVSLERPVCIVLHKPVSYVTTVEDPEGRRTVMDLLDGVTERVYPVGRLDYETSGLLLLTNDGDLTYRLLHPKFHVDKRYRATVLGMPEAEILRQLREGIQLDDGKTAPAEISVLRHHPKESVIEITIREGRNRQVRRMFEAVDHPVKRLKRTQFGPLDISQLASGHWRYLTPEEVRKLYEAVELTPPPTVDILEEGKTNRRLQTGGRATSASRPVRGESRDDRATSRQQRSGRPTGTGQRAEQRSGRPTSRGQRAEQGRGRPSGRGQYVEQGSGRPTDGAGAPERQQSRNRAESTAPAMKTQSRSNSYGADRRRALSNRPASKTGPSRRDGNKQGGARRKGQ